MKSVPQTVHTVVMGRSEFVPGEVLTRVQQYLPSPYLRFAQRWELQDTNGTPLTTERIARGRREITLDDGKQYLCRSGWSRSFKVTRMGESVVETRSGDLIDEPIRFRGHDLRYSMTFTDPPDRWRRREGDRTINCEMVISDGDVAALSVTEVNDARKNWLQPRPILGRCVVLDDALGPDTPLIGSVAFELFTLSFSSGGGGGV
jgi:hypothetical protein